ncbi:hypothetical protein [Pseudanabaena sp. UWO310]|uniref:hypothetical protein n=1 Tax=Pseudanabaena sp. UWO310 TaxID=2480795 RepID=UPI00115BBD1A|nr:hypothetical protein [Pseudanabaena sp. UWO310]TYQ31157.1 hypothetical protein PseudUWO310_05275 [Pseudanabaena sp. UWO310]
MVRVNWCCGILVAIAIGQGVLPVETIQASPWDSILESFSRRPKPPLGGRSEFCAISPRRLPDGIESTSGDRLLFVWNGMISKIEVHAEGVGAPLWSQVVKLDARQAEYTGSPLIAGARYEWWIFNRFAVNETKPTFRVPFQVIESSERERVTLELAELNSQIRDPKKWVSAEEWSRKRSQYFVSQGLFVDAMREILSVQRPSQELRTIWQQIPIELCKRG